MNAVIFIVLFASSGLDAANTEIWYEVSNLSPGRWEYTYEVYNISLSVAIEEFTIWFKYGDYYDLVVTTPDPPASDWSEIVWDPEPVLQDDGAYDAKAEAWILGIGVGENVSGFSVSFDWLPGTGQPGSQFYEIVVPNTSPVVVIDSGWTIPEPGTLWLMGLGGLMLRKKRKT